MINPASTIASDPSVAPDVVARFSAEADQWWQPDGAFRFLHLLGPQRLAYVKAHVARHFGREEGAEVLAGLSILDVGCGGGLMAEPLAKGGAKVMGIDASAESIAIAKAHASESAISIDYREATAEALVQEGRIFDVVIAYEIIEHVADLPAFLGALAQLVRPGGLLILSSLNRTWKSLVFGVWAAEYLLGWVPPGTHEWRRFVKPSELASLLAPMGLQVQDATGLVFNPVDKSFALRKGKLALDYLFCAKKG